MPFELCHVPSGLDLASLNYMKNTGTTFFKSRFTIPVKNGIGLLLVIMGFFAGLDVQAKKKAVQIPAAARLLSIRRVAEFYSTYFHTINHVRVVSS